jgi:two-component system, NarL family, response regulator NreC
MPVRIVLADDHVMVRQALKSVLEHGGFEVTGEASDGRQAIQLCLEQKPEIAVLDISMPLLNGVGAAREILKVSPRTRVIFLTMHAGDDFVLEGLRSGVHGYVVKTKDVSELVQAIRTVSHGEVYLSPGISRTVLEGYLAGRATSSDPLSAREREVLQLVAEGKTTKEVAVVLGISTSTAESHRTNIMEKLDIHDTAGLVRYAIRHKIIQS